jgi:hypothetical protein
MTPRRRGTHRPITLDTAVPTGDDFRQIALALPEAEERETWGHPTFRVRNKMFATMATDGTAVSVKATKEAQAALVGSEPGTFSIPAYVGQHGWVRVTLANVDREELRELITEAWLMTAPKRLARELQE